MFLAMHTGSYAMYQAAARLRDGGTAFFAVECRRPARLRAGVFDLGVKDQLMPFLCHVDLIGHLASLVVIAFFWLQKLPIKSPAELEVTVCKQTDQPESYDGPYSG
jgi:hypothetical protein